MIRFREKDTLSKVDVLLKKSLHALAISLAAEEQAPVMEVLFKFFAVASILLFVMSFLFQVMKLYKLYGDHLFRRNDFEAAVAQYSHTIGFVPASYVIRRFLDSQRIGYLTSYLETLHSKGFASKDLTTLLLTCYTKTRDVDRLDAFISQGDAFAAHRDLLEDTPKVSNDDQQLSIENASRRFDISAAITTLRHAGYTKHAMKLALRYADHDSYLSMILYPSDIDSNIGSHNSSDEASSDVTNPVEAAFGHIVGIVDDVVASVKHDLENGYKFTTVVSSRAAHYMTRKMLNGNSMRITEQTNEKLEALLALLKRHGRRMLYLMPDAMTGILIMLYTGVPLGVVKETRTDGVGEERSGDLEMSSSSAIDLRELLTALSAQSDSDSTNNHTRSTIQVSTYSDPLYCVEELGFIFVDDIGNDTIGNTPLGVSRPDGWQKRYQMTFLEGSLMALTSNGGNKNSKAIIKLKGGRTPKLSSHMTALLIELCLEQYDKLKNSSVASSSAEIIGIPVMSEQQRKLAMNQLEVKIMNMLDGTVAADYDVGHIMLLVHSFNFTPGMLYLLEKSQSVDVILGQLRNAKDYNGIFRILRREGHMHPDLLLQELELFVMDTVHQQRHQKNNQKEKSPRSAPIAVLKQSRDSDDEYQSSHNGKSSDTSSSGEDSDEEDGIFDHVETMLDILEPEIFYACGDISAEQHHGHISISQVLKILALNPTLPLSIPLGLIKNAVRGASLGLRELEKDTYKMRLTVDSLVNKPVVTAKKKVLHSGGHQKVSANPFGDSDSDEDGNHGGVMLGYNEADDNGIDSISSLLNVIYESLMVIIQAMKIMK